MPAYYDRKTHNFWLLTEKHGWTQVTRDLLKLYIIEKAGYSTEPGSSLCLRPGLSRVDEEINRVIQENQIDLSCDVAGWQMGLYNMYGKRVLVQENPKLLTATEGDWSFYESLLRTVSRNHKIQYDVLKSWLLLGLTKIYTREYRYSQILIMVGNASSGKSLMQLMITVLAGGHESDPVEWMLGSTTFGKDNIEAEHLCIAEPSVVSLKDIQMLYNRYKELSVKEGRRCRGLYTEAITLAPYQMVSVTLNPEQKNLQLVPEPSAGIEDKFHALFFPSDSFPLPGFPLLSMAEIKKIVQAQAPAFLWHLFNEYKIPESLQKRVLTPPYDCHRFGMDPYHNPTVMAMVMERSDEARFLALFERISSRTGMQPFKGSVSKLAGWIQDESREPDAKRLTQDTQKLGYLLRSLHKRYPEKVQQVDIKTKKYGTIWLILPDPEQPQEN